MPLDHSTRSIPKELAGAATSGRNQVQRSTFQEIMAIGDSRDQNRLDGLTYPDLNVLFSYLNRLRVPLSEEGAFANFYLAVVERIRSGRH